MSRFNHNICEKCWEQATIEWGQPGREACRMKPEYAPLEKCCFCGELNRWGAFRRLDPKTTNCLGFHWNYDEHRPDWV